MNDFIYYSPTEFVFGRGVEEGVGAKAAARGFKKALLVYGKGSVVRSGLLDRVKASLDAAGVAHVDLAGVRPNPEVASVREGIRMVREQQADLILPVGGGSAIDCAKAVAFGALYDGDVWDFFCGKAKVERALPIFCVLTIPAAGSEASSSCVISNDELHAKRGTNGDAFRPAVAFMNPEITFTLPAYQTAAGVTDMIAHICERWFSGVGPVPVTDNIASGLIRALVDAAPRVLENPEDYDARADIMWAGMLAHNDIAGCGRSLAPTGRAGGWESHGLEHEMSAFDTSITHGAGLAVIMPAWMRYVWREDPSRFLQFALDVFDIEPVDESDEAVEDAVTAAIDELQAFFVDMGMPKTMGELGLREEDVDAIVETLRATKGDVFGAFKKISMEDAKAIYLSAFVDPALPALDEDEAEEA
ncbi:MAG: iron-containing alcohol dehydrogenase [Slackia faecicanis]|nr:iron-containing alcohol dehydrogenase [Slackia faecicanis]